MHRIIISIVIAQFVIIGCKKNSPSVYLPIPNKTYIYKLESGRYDTILVKQYDDVTLEFTYSNNEKDFIKKNKDGSFSISLVANGEESKFYPIHFKKGNKWKDEGGVKMRILDIGFETRIEKILYKNCIKFEIDYREFDSTMAVKKEIEIHAPGIGLIQRSGKNMELSGKTIYKIY